MLTGSLEGYVFLGIIFLANVLIFGVAKAKENKITKANAEQTAKVFLRLMVTLLATNLLNLVMLFNRVDQIGFIVPSLVFAVFSIFTVRPQAIRRYAEAKRLL